MEEGTNTDPDGRYAKGGIKVPKTECLKDVLERALPYWESDIVPDLKAGKTVLIAAHGNSLRALMKDIEGISDEDIPGVEIPTGVPILYDLDDNMKPVGGGKGKHLD
jgi:2,3-bisphosphoglycerate-dependent phosphoglycerate mutase